ncbi:MAG: SemiSWEET family sugar transporter [Ferruginibacter sp.]
METAEIIGHIGSFLSSVTFLPQVWQTWKTRRVHDLNGWMLGIVFTSTIVWLIYGWLIQAWPVIICNSIICVLSLMLLFFKWTFR